MKAHTYTVVCEARQGKKVLSLTALKRYADMVQDIGLGEERLMRILQIPKAQGTQLMRWYRGIVIPDIATACGYTDPDDYQSVHDAMAWRFLRIDDHPDFGYPRRRSTSKDDLSAEEMHAYVQQVIEHAESSIPGCQIRRPDEIDNWRDVYAADFDAGSAA